MKRLFIWIAGAALLAAPPAARAAGQSPYSHLPAGRRMLFNKWEEPDPATGETNLVDYGDYYGGWTHEGPGFGPRAKKNVKRLLAGTNHVHASGWAVAAGRTGSPSLLGDSIPPEEYAFPVSGVNNATNWMASLQNVAGAYIESPFYPDGIGTLYFDAINVDGDKPVAMIVEISKNRDGGDWVQIAETNVSGLVRFRQEIRHPGGVRFRIRRGGGDTNAKPDTALLAVDNIQVSLPVTGLTLYTPAIAKVPGKPTSAKISCQVFNEGGAEGTDHESRRMTVFYKSGGGAYSNAPMEYVTGSGDGAGNEEKYTAEIDFPDGEETESLTFYCECQVTGGRYRFLPTDYTGQKNFRFWDTEDGAEPPVTGRSPERKFDVSVWVTAASSFLPAGRRMLFNRWEETNPETGETSLNDYGDYYAPFAAGGWTHEGPGFAPRAKKNVKRLLAGTNHVHASGWAVIAGRTGSPSLLGESIPPDDYDFPGANGSTNWMAILQNVGNARIESPFYTNGIGTLYFDTVANDPNRDVAIAVEVATNMFDDAVDPDRPENIMFDREFSETDEGGNPHIYRYNWVEIASLTVGTNLTHFQHQLLYRNGIRFRIRRTDNVTDAKPDTTFLAVDNIQASTPPSDVRIRKESATFLPPYPAPGEPSVIRCRVDNVDTNVPTDFAMRSVKVYYRWRYLDQAFEPADRSWLQADMSHVPDAEGDDGAGNGELYEAELPGQPREGDLEYYFVCGFDGFRYKPVDYTGTGHEFWPRAFEKGTEALPPRTLGSKSGGDPEFTLRIRRARSDYGAVSIVTDCHSNAIPMTLEEDGLWRGWIPLHVGTTSVTNFSFRFRGEGGYDPASKTVSTNFVFWAEAGAGQAGRKAITLPSGGICADVTGMPDAKVPVSEPLARYALVALDLSKTNYTICRADYQNFDEWIARDDPAPADIFSESGWQSFKIKYHEPFDSWTPDEDDLKEQYFSNADLSQGEGGGPYKSSFQTVEPAWMARSARYEKERTWATGKNKPAVSDKRPNCALRLMGMDSLRRNTELIEIGSAYTPPKTLTDGIKTFTFKARAASGIDPGRIAHYLNKFGASFYKIKASFSVLDRSPGEHSVSLVGLYRDSRKFFELRIIQIGPTKEKPNTDRIRVELHRWEGGRDTRLASKVSDGSIGKAQAVLDLSDGMNVKGAYGDVKLNVKMSYAAFRGTVGFMAADCRVSPGQLIMETTDVATPEIIPYNPDLWNLGDGAFEIGNNNTTLSSKAPSQKLGVYTLKTDYADPADPDTAIDKWQRRETVTLNSFNYKDFLFTWKDWQAEYVRLQVLSDPDVGRYDAVVDELVTSSWHGKMHPAVNGMSPDNGIDSCENSWLVTEGWVEVEKYGGEDRLVRLDSSRARSVPDYGTDWMELPGYRYKYIGPQGVRSPLLENGRGSIEILCRVKDRSKPVRLTLQKASKWSPELWTDCTWMQGSPNAGKRKSVVVNNDWWTRISFYAGDENGGYLRIVNDFRDNAGDGLPTCRNGAVEIRTADAWDNPASDETSWCVYNAMISKRDPGLVILDGSRGCTLNNSREKDAEPLQDLAPPFIKAPLLLGGLGEISFDARTFDPHGTATVYVYVTKSDWKAMEEEWVRAAAITVDTPYFKHYAFNIGQDGEDYKGVRLQTKIGERRVCIENVSVGEPVYPGFDITDTRPICQKDEESFREEFVQQPLNLDKVGLEARLSNVRMSPTNIEVWVEYYIGTNAWGVGNWPSFRRLGMKQVEGNPALYRTSIDDGGFGFLEAGDVVQYRVCASYTDSEGRPYSDIRQKKSGFVNPPWYEPVDLNKTFKDRGWSPYFMVYDIPLGCIFINEFNIFEGSETYEDTASRQYSLPYVEIALPEIVSLKGWKLKFVKGEHHQTTNTVFLPSHAEKKAVTNGYAFYVVGMTPGEIAGISGMPKIDYVDYGDIAFKDSLAKWGKGAILLERPMGMIEHSVAYFGQDDDYGYGKEWADKAPGGAILYAGAEGTSNSLSVAAGKGDGADEWRHLRWTPGLPNVGQTLPEIQTISFGYSNVIVTAKMDPASFARTTQNGIRKNISFRLPRGASTNIVYSLQPWYRLASVTVNGKDESGRLRVEHGTNSVYTLPLNDLQTNTEVCASAAILSRLSDPDVTNIVRNWVMSYPDKPLADSSYNGRPMSLTELFWFDADPTVPHVIEGSISDIELDPDTNFYITAFLALDGTNNCTYLNSGTDENGNTVSTTFKLWVKQNLDDPVWELLPPQYAIAPDSFDTNHKCRIFVPNPFIQKPSQPAWLYGWDASHLFFRWQIEFDAGAASLIFTMTNNPVAAPAP